MQKEYGDESLIYAMSLMRSDNRRSENIQNDIDNGYAVIDEIRIPFSDREIIEKKLFMTMPQEFTILSLENAKAKYPSEDRPDIIYSNEDGSINISFTITKDYLVDGEVADARDYLQEIMEKINPSIKITSISVFEGKIRGGYFDFISPALDGEIFNR